MLAINRKTLRDLRGMSGQAIAIVLVMVAGISTYVSMTSVMETLQRTLAIYYLEYGFAEGFASVRRAPQHLEQRIRGIPGINQVESRVTAGVNLEVPGFAEPVAGLLVSIPEGRQPALNRLFIREGRLVRPGREGEVLLNETFAQAHRLRPGDRLSVVVNGRRRVLTVVGVALSPEFLMQMQPGSLFPDPERYGVLWMGREALAAAYDMEGAFNDVAFTVAPGVSIDDVIEEVDVLLKPYGGQGAFSRTRQPSHFLISEEFNQLAGMATILPMIFLAVAAFLLNIVVTRLINLQREQIAVLKAFGYRNTDVGLHYLKLVLLIALGGVAGGTALGVWMGRSLAELYLDFYRFPYLEHTLRPQVVLTAVLLTTGASFVGVINAVRRAVKLPPAEAMRPAPPAAYRPTVVERLGLQRLFDQPTRMIMRNLERQPVKALLTVVGMAFSCAILIMGLFWGDSIAQVIRVQYGIAQREDLTVAFIQPTSTAAVHELASLPGVSYVEPFRTIPVRLRHRHRVYDTAIEGIPKDAYLRRVIDIDLQPIYVPAEGLVLTDRLAEILQVAPGDVITVEVLEGTRRIRSVQLVAVARQYLGLGAYMDMEAANRLGGEGQAVSGAFLMTDERYEAELNRALQDRPRVASIVSQERAIQSYMETAAESTLIFTFVLSLFAGVIAFGVIYNSARISLSERDRELASLRVLGFTRGEIAYILLGELAVLTLLSIPVGLVLGSVISAGVAEATATEIYEFPLVLGRGTFALAAAIVLGAAFVSALIVRHRLNRLDLVGVLKTRE